MNCALFFSFLGLLIMYPDYIFVVDPFEYISTVMGLSKPRQTKELEPGLPKAGVSGSDHISLCTEIGWEKIHYH